MDDGFEQSARDVEERADDLRVELRPGAALQLGRRLFVPDRWTIRALARHRVEGVGHRDHAGVEVYLLAAQVRGIATAVPALVVFGRHAAHASGRSDAEQHARAVEWVLAHGLPLFGRQPPLLMQNLAGDEYLAEVVSQRAQTEDA